MRSREDSISDPWYPLGNGNLMHQLDFGLHLSHMMSVEQISNSLRFVTTNGAKTMCVGDYGFKEGNSREYMTPMEARRMGRLMKAATMTSLMALRESGVETPDAIVTATAYGMLETSEVTTAFSFFTTPRSLKRRMTV